MGRYKNWPCADEYILMSGDPSSQPLHDEDETRASRARMNVYPVMLAASWSTTPWHTLTMHNRHFGRRDVRVQLQRKLNLSDSV